MKDKKILFILSFLLIVPCMIFAQSDGDNKEEQANLKVFEERLKHLEEKSKYQLRALEEKRKIQNESLKS